MLNLLSNILLPLLVCDFTFIECACHDKVDLVYLVDSSGSVGSINFNKEKEFINNSLSQFIIGYNDALVGVVTFSTIPREQFKLNAFLDKAALIYAITKIPYLTGNTHTAEAINFVNSHMFIPSSGDRADAQNVLVVLTDGQSSDPAKTLQEVNRLKQRNTVVIAVGIGSGVSKSELNAMVSDPSYVLFVNDFDALKQIHDVVHSVACNLVNTATTPRPPQVTTFVKTSPPPKTTTEATTISPTSVCVDVIPNCNQYGQTVCVGTYKPWASRNCAYYCKLCNDEQFEMNAFLRKTALIDAVMKTPYQAGGTHTTKAVHYINKHMYKHSSGDRTDAQKYLWFLQTESQLILSKLIKRLIVLNKEIP
ncbi:COL6A [Mytilus coruscus]|uniref:COL6A n=1 Tax=Mytilus coruscus TaxID=42192 RepID=A0A6J8B8D5_MYTCO|nr:COL6A [Mytilus coruscus]